MEGTGERTQVSGLLISSTHTPALWPPKGIQGMQVGGELLKPNWSLSSAFHPHPQLAGAGGGHLAPAESLLSQARTICAISLPPGMGALLGGSSSHLKQPLLAGMLAPGGF